jgi:hypothetical protein
MPRGGFLAVGGLKLLRLINPDQNYPKDVN